MTSTTMLHAVASDDDDDDDFPSSSSSSRRSLDFAWDPVPVPVGAYSPSPLSSPSPSPSPRLTSAALAGLYSATRAVSAALRLLLPFLPSSSSSRKKGNKSKKGSYKNSSEGLRIIVPRPRDVARLTLAVVAAAAVLLAAVLFFDAVGERLVTATLSVAKK